MSTPRQTQDHIASSAHPISGHYPDYDPLVQAIGDARVVLLGESSHGTHEFYHERARITRRLIEEEGFTIVAVEADWPDAYRVNRFVRATGGDASAAEALGGFERFPTWMWRNTDVLTFVDWLREHNAARPHGTRAAGFYGLDLYSMFTSMHEVVRYLDTVDAEAAERARYRYGCFEVYGEDSQAYGFAAEVGASRSCEDQAIQQLEDLRRRAAELASRDGRIPEDEFFYAEQNARLVSNAEEYYRSMFGGRISSWNLRDQHMAETLEALLGHFDSRGGDARAVVWAHNTHVGDARATDMGEQGELNVGQLARERWGAKAYSVGFSTFEGTVTAASNWDAPAERKRVRPGLPEGYEALFHDSGLESAFLPIRGDSELERELGSPRLERAIGVIYRPETERLSHYFHARLARQFDAIVHIDHSRAVEPLDPGELWHPGGEAPETFPSGL
jgi:erythromycin esterase-like protein